MDGIFFSYFQPFSFLKATAQHTVSSYPTHDWEPVHVVVHLLAFMVVRAGLFWPL